MRTTLSINDVILRELHEQASASGRSFRDVVEQNLEIGLAHVSKPQSRGRFHVRAHRLGIKPGVQGVSLNQIYDQLEVEEDGRRP